MTSGPQPELHGRPATLLAPPVVLVVGKNFTLSHCCSSLLANGRQISTLLDLPGLAGRGMGGYVSSPGGCAGPRSISGGVPSDW